jgi:TrkA domain protein
VSRIREVDLPGVGRKFEIETRSGDRLVVVVHDDGRRELYHVRQVAAIVGGLAYKPQALAEAEVALAGLVIDWLRLPPGAPAAGQTIGALRVREQTGATVIALVGPGRRPLVAPGPEDRLEPGATVVVAGDREQVRSCRRLLLGS